MKTTPPQPLSSLPAPVKSGRPTPAPTTSPRPSVYIIIDKTMTQEGPGVNVCPKYPRCQSWLPQFVLSIDRWLVAAEDGEPTVPRARPLKPMGRWAPRCAAPRRDLVERAASDAGRRVPSAQPPARLPMPPAQGRASPSACCILAS